MTCPSNKLSLIWSQQYDDYKVPEDIPRYWSGEITSPKLQISTVEITSTQVEFKSRSQSSIAKLMFGTSLMKFLRLLKRGLDDESLWKGHKGHNFSSAWKWAERKVLVEQVTSQVHYHRGTVNLSNALQYRKTKDLILTNPRFRARYWMPEDVNKAEIEKLVRDWDVAPGVRAKLARAVQVKTLVEATNAGDMKTALDAVRSIASDPEVGMDKSSMTTITYTVSTGLQSVLDDVELPKSLQAPEKVQVKESAIIDAEFTDITESKPKDDKS